MSGDGDRVEDLLAEFVERRDRGEPLTADVFLAEHSGAADTLRPALLALAATEALLPDGDLPTNLGSYRIERRLGRGGTGEVFAARAADGRAVAIKRLLPHLGRQPRAVERLRREGDALRALAHPCIVGAEAVGEDPGAHYLVMERIDGGSLADVLAAARQRRSAGDRRAPADLLHLAGEGPGEHRVIFLVLRLAQALALVHRHGLLHRDIKPGNVLLRRDGTPVLVDFGLATVPDAETLTRTGDVLGTPNYMAPEQAMGRDASAQSDVYGLAAVLYELVTLSPPHPGRDPLQVLSAVRSLPSRPARSLAPAVSPALATVLRRALAYAPQHRWRDAEALASALAALLAGTPPARMTVCLQQRLGEFWLVHRRSLLGVGAAAMALALVAVLWQARLTANRTRGGKLALQACTSLLDDPDDAAAGVAIAEALAAVGAEPGLAALLRHDASDDPFCNLLQQGLAAQATDPAAAVATFRQALDLRPDLPLAGALLGLAAARIDDDKSREAAERELLTAGRLLPQCVRVRRELAEVRHRRRDHAGVAAAWREVIVLRPDDAPAHYELGRALANDMQGEAALVAIDHALALHAGEPPPAWLHAKGAVLDGLGRRTEAIACLQTAVARRPTPNTWHSLALLYDKEHRLPEAAAAYRSALAIDVHHAASIFNLAFLLAGSNSAECEPCRACFAAHPELRDPAEVERLALRMLDAEHGSFAHAAAITRIAASVDSTAVLAARLDALLAEPFTPAAIGCLFQARQVLAAK
jgi:serine/threonine protein kinase/tetratricopeptide (TPR) repeat protein